MVDTIRQSLGTAFDRGGADTGADLGNFEAAFGGGQIAGMQVGDFDIPNIVAAIATGNDGDLPTDMIVVAKSEICEDVGRAGRLEDYPQEMQADILKNGLPNSQLSTTPGAPG